MKDSLKDVVTKMSSKLVLWPFFVVLACAGPAFGQETSEDKEFPQDDLVMGNPHNNSGPYLGLNLGFGQARAAGQDEGPGIAFLVSLEPGYQIKRGSWSRLELGLQMLTGRLGFQMKEDQGDAVSMPIAYGLLAKVGYGYSLGGGVFGVFKLGAGPVTSKFEGERSGIDIESSYMTGFAYQLSYNLVLPVADMIDLTGGLIFEQYVFNAGDVEDSQGNKTDIGTLSVNVPRLEMGVRLRL